VLSAFATRSDDRPGNDAVPRLSIVIPCERPEIDFEDTLASVLQNRPKGCEILVVQPRPYDDPYSLSGDVRFLETAANLSIVELVNVGVQQAKSEVVNLLGCDVVVTDGWTESVLSHFENRKVASVVPRLVHGTAPHQAATAGVAYGLGGQRLEHASWQTAASSNQTNTLGPELRAGFYRRQAVLDVGGFCVDVGEHLADIDVAIALWASGHETVHEESSILVTARDNATASLSFQRGMEEERLFWRNAALFDIDFRKLLTWHTGVIAAQLASKFYRPSMLCHLAGRMLAMSTKSVDQQRPETIKTTAAAKSGRNATVALPHPALESSKKLRQRRAA
jgi:GT2 family glycosyltransferase